MFKLWEKLMIASDLLYSKDSRKAIRTWQFEVEGNKWRSISGLIDGKKVVSSWTVCQGKNIGRANETTPEEQAQAEATADFNKRVDREYRKTIPELDFVPISPMLAQDYKKQKKILLPVLSQPKLDGIRALITRNGAYSREYKEHLNVEHIMEALAPVFKEFPDVELDGELYNHDLKDDFNTITSIVRKKNVTAKDRERARELIQFHCYDTVNESGFDQRYMDVAHMLQFCNDSIQTVETSWAYDQDELDNLFAGYIQRGYEGQMVRLPKGEYESDKRSKLLLKRKTFVTEEFKLLAIEEGEGNWAGYAKTCKVLLPDGRTNDSGMRGNQAFALEKLVHKDKYIGFPVTVRYFGYTPDGKLRFPVIIDWHPNGRVD